MEKIIILVGTPGCGKSRIAKDLNQLGFKWLSADIIRERLFGKSYMHNSEGIVWSTFYRELKEALNSEINIVIDNTNIRKTDRNQILKNVQAINKGYKLLTWLFDIPLDVCKERNLNRERIVPEEVLENFYYKLETRKDELLAWEADKVIGVDGLSMEELKELTK